MTTSPRRWSIVGATAVTPDGVLPQATIIVHGERIESVGYRPPRGEVVDLAGHFVLPGFIDLHVHGGGGASFNSNDPGDIDAAIAFHRTHGTTRTLASLVSESIDNTISALHAIARSQSRADGTLLGAHLEGPFLSPDRPGCHDLKHLLAPDPAALDRLLSAEPGLVKTITIAPEIAGADALIERLVHDGIRVGIGHSAADYATAEAAFAHGAHFVTHAHNAMDPVRHRAPGIIAAAAQQRKPLELISDGIHVHPSVVAMTFNAAPGRIVLITDAAPAAGLPAGTLSHIGSAAVVTQEDGRITRRDSDILAGSALTMDAALRHTLTAGVALEAAVHAISTAPASLLGLQQQMGALQAGLLADLVILDSRYHVQQVFVAGVATTQPEMASLPGRRAS